MHLLYKMIHKYKSIILLFMDILFYYVDISGKCSALSCQQSSLETVKPGGVLDGHLEPDEHSLTSNSAKLDGVITHPSAHHVRLFNCL